MRFQRIATDAFSVPTVPSFLRELRVKSYLAPLPTAAALVDRTGQGD